MNNYDLIIVGGGIAGYHTAFTARQNCADMRILVISGETVPTYSAPSLPDYIAGHMKREKAFVASEADYAAKNIDLQLGVTVTSADAGKKTLVTDKGETYTYKHLVLATGSLPIQLRRMQGTSLPGNHVLKTVQDADFLATGDIKRAVVVGTGAIGLESASSLKERGVEDVTLVEALGWINPKSFDKKASDYMVAELERIGVRVVLGEGITAVEGATEVTGVHTAKQFIPCDTVVWGIGMRPVTDLAASMGVELGSAGGVKVDELMRTNLADVYAVGDCTEPYDMFFQKYMPNMLWRTATEQGMLVGQLITGAADEEDAYEGAKLLFLTYVGDAVACAYGHTEGSLQGQKYTVLEDCQENSYRKVILQDNYIMGFQMVNTLEGSNELYAQMLKGVPIDLEEMDLSDPINTPLKYLCLGKYLLQMHS
ncbi:MAG: FAD-dependent oxidoreductase [Oscillibacter sp.]|nr:FAD-dependent oxidoreductase [Oscillibacter sp.]MBQ7778807.1 FAD-dependent oxidoreductase [Oscillibacter sp.]